MPLRSGKLESAQPRDKTASVWPGAFAGFVECGVIGAVGGPSTPSAGVAVSDPTDPGILGNVRASGTSNQSRWRKNPIEAAGPNE